MKFKANRRLISLFPKYERKAKKALDLKVGRKEFVTSNDKAIRQSGGLQCSHTDYVNWTRWQNFQDFQDFSRICGGVGSIDHTIVP